MSDPKLHHYVPQFYLERFTNSDGRLWVFDKKLNRKFCSSPKNIAAETKFYYVSELVGTKCTPLFVEKQFSALESNIAQITGDWLNQLNNCKDRGQLKISAFERNQMPGILSPETCITLPLSPTIILYCERKSLTKKLKQFNNCLSPVEFTEGMVDHENSGQVFMSLRFIFAPTNDFEDAENFWEKIQNETSPTVEEMIR
jgi:hypothetical protein